MLSPQFFYGKLTDGGVGFFSGVPDSLLKSFCAYLTDNAAADRHIIAVNEGAAVGLAAGYHLSTDGLPLVYMQNSGIGNAVNPLLSLVDGDVYGIPLILVIGWRGEPGFHDEPQHVKQGKVTISLLDAMGIPHTLLDTDEAVAAAQIERGLDTAKKSSAAYAFVIRKDTFAPYTLQKKDASGAVMTREEAIEVIAAAREGVIISTTGMASRELYEIRERNGSSHERDFLTVGSMGHASSIALAVAQSRPKLPVTCLDGDGATLMHMGALATVGTAKPANLLHIVLNNEAHDSVGGQPTVAGKISLTKIAAACGYPRMLKVSTKNELTAALDTPLETLTLIEVAVKKGTRADLGRPKSSPAENKAAFMNYIKNIKL